MAERVAWRCSFPGCGVITIGPKMGDDEKSLNLGEAAHIHAASSKGPRFDSNMTPEDRKSIHNGIWMCRSHATFIDSDYKEFSVETLKLWKSQAEESAYEDLKYQEGPVYQDNSTLIAIGFSLIVFCHWKSVCGLEWTFEINSILKGSEVELKEYVSNFSSLSSDQKFIVVESQGDARKIKQPVRIEYTEPGNSMIIFDVKEKHVATDPNMAGCDLALGEDGDLLIENGDLKSISGIDAAKQHLTMATSTVYGEWWADPTLGSFVSEYYRIYKDDLSLLSRLIKVEFIRLSLISSTNDQDRENFLPTLHFVKRFNDVTVKSAELKDSRINVTVSLEWGNGDKWTGTVPIWINKT